MANGQCVDGGDRQAVSHIVGASSIVRGYVVPILGAGPSRIISVETGNAGFGVERLGPGISRDQIERARPMFEFDVHRVVVGKAVKNGIDESSQVCVGHTSSDRDRCRRIHRYRASVLRDALRGRIGVGTRKQVGAMVADIIDFELVSQGSSRSTPRFHAR